MASKGSSGSRRWIERRPIDTRPIVGLHDDNLPAWLKVLERVAPWGCFAVLAVTLALTAYIFGADWIAGHWRP